MSRRSDRLGQHRIIVDLGDVSFIDSTGLHVLLKARRRLEEVGGTLLVVCGDTNTRRVFEVSGVVELLRLVESRQNAIMLAAAFAPASIPAPRL
jgi:anti-anti-sigma factor